MNEEQCLLLSALQMPHALYNVSQKEVDFEVTFIMSMAHSLA